MHPPSSCLFLALLVSESLLTSHSSLPLPYSIHLSLPVHQMSLVFLLPAWGTDRMLVENIICWERILLWAKTTAWGMDFACTRGVSDISLVMGRGCLMLQNYRTHPVPRLERDFHWQNKVTHLLEVINTIFCEVVKFQSSSSTLKGELPEL